MRRRDRPLVTDLALAGDFAARILEDFELLLIDGDFNSAFVVNPCAYFGEHSLQEGFVDMRFIAQRKIQIL